MRKIVEKLFKGEIQADSMTIIPDKAYHEAFENKEHIINYFEKKLSSDKEVLCQFEKLCESEDYLSDTERLSSFTNGLKIGAQLVWEIFTETS